MHLTHEQLELLNRAGITRIDLSEWIETVIAEAVLLENTARVKREASAIAVVPDSFQKRRDRAEFLAYTEAMSDAERRELAHANRPLGVRHSKQGAAA